MGSVQMPTTDSAVEILLGICGAGGFAREILPIAKEILLSPGQTNAGACRIVFVEKAPAEALVNGVPVVSEDEFFDQPCGQRYFNVAVGDSKLRESIALDFMRRGAAPFALHSRNTIIGDDSEIGEGAIICGYSMVTPAVRIGRFFHSNMYSYVAHDSVIGDFVTFAPRVNCNGNVHIGDHAYIGTAATLRQGTAEKPLTIGEGAVVGMGAVVTKDVPAFTTVVGNPAKPLIKKDKK